MNGAFNRNDALLGGFDTDGAEHLLIGVLRPLRANHDAQVARTLAHAQAGHLPQIGGSTAIHWAGESEMAIRQPFDLRCDSDRWPANLGEFAADVELDHSALACRMGLFRAFRVPDYAKTGTRRAFVNQRRQQAGAVAHRPGAGVVLGIADHHRAG